MHEYSTPMMRQYMEVKKNYKDCLLLFRMGDFYELFMEDAHIGARVLNITLTSKAGGKDGKIPMAGVPYHAADTYIAKLVKNGYKVAICEQLSPPNKKGLVKRDVVRVVTPGTLLDESNLEKKENNFIVSILIESDILALSVADISTGYFATSEFVYDNLGKTLQEELSKLNPIECILPEELYSDSDILKLVTVQKGLNVFSFSKWDMYSQNASKFLKKHFGVSTLSSFAIEEKKVSQKSSAALLGYLQDTQKGSVSHIRKISSLTQVDGLIIDRSTMINLELFSTIREHDVKGSLLDVLDNTTTAMGGRMLKAWIKKPLAQKEDIEKRMDSVEEFIQKPEQRILLQDLLKQIPDIERLLSRLSVNLGNARDLVNLKNSLKIILDVKKLLEHSNSELLKEQGTCISKHLEKILKTITIVIVDEPPLSIKDGGMIRNGVHKKLDELRETIGKSKTFILNLEKSEKEKTGINSLKIRYNSVFGFYIELSKANMHLAPKHYLRKQTLVNCERYITKELKVHEEIILTAEEKINELEYKLFQEVSNFVISQTDYIQAAAESVAVVDCIINFGALSEKQQYTRPTLLYSGEIRIKQGRHPVVEKLLDDQKFVPNDLSLDNINQQLLIITGPNMAGKSVFIRQVAIIVLMAQLGCFVPAQSAHISVVDRIFVRSGASDVITSGLSTFMVEMVETAYILNNATKNSLIIMDEIGRGTSTYDGISIAWAVAEYLVKYIQPSPKTLFATHYHELQTLEEQYPKQIKNFHMAVTEEKGEPIFLHTILPGGASHSFGVAVAKLAGVPKPVIDKAYEILQNLEFRDVEKGKNYQNITLNETKNMEKSPLRTDNSSLIDRIIQKEIAQLDIANLTPLEALNKLSDLKDKLKLLNTHEDFREAD